MRWTNEKKKIVETLSSVISNNKKLLLDIGAGNGEITTGIADRFDHIVAIEPSKTLFEQLRKVCRTQKFTLVEKPFEKVILDQKFDVIISSHSFQFITNPTYELTRIKELLSDSGMLILINLKQDCEYIKLYHKFRKKIFGPESTYAQNLNFEYDIMELLQQFFNVKQSFFDTQLTIPTIDDYISLLDFFYDVPLSSISPDTIMFIKKELYKDYGDNPIKINFEQAMYICTK
ncbi:MAG: hypothetical protein US13_C0002G0177 [candidate division TM6 bacterium GW2011_GWE2_36_25]|nr:MAG: hypothetical protein US03_C0002G0178 [candidate division TM6 bacterium GW2011_GWF2_36_131]KKQ03611.1 MAG: hypothetical protein US13_C0002G0177 [candidate division TM6 bacterium GW2011_GWE2_36_25]KKQ20112.1 MAG: hypothetical protein US32_C0001G0009 [candidate division TM6 bacterium GW2011_GWA2_36_9]